MACRARGGRPLPRRIVLRAAAEVRGPVGLPGLTAVRGERLLPVGRSGGDPRPREARPDGPAVEYLVAVETADAVLEAADHRRQPEEAVPAARPVDRPLACLPVEEADRQPAAAKFREGYLVDVGCPVEDLPASRCRCEFGPLVTIGEPCLTASLDAIPGPDEEVEVARAGHAAPPDRPSATTSLRYAGRSG